MSFSLVNSKLLLALLLFAVGQTMGWFQLNSQFVWDWWKDKPLVAACVFQYQPEYVSGMELRYAMLRWVRFGAHVFGF